jgi:hypothetical protein
MRRRFRLFALAVPATLAFSFFVTASGADGTTRSPGRPTASTALNEETLASIRLGLQEATSPNADSAHELVRVTAKPFHVLPRNPAACESQSARAPMSPHKGHWIHVYVTQVGYDTMMSGKGTYPPGTIILKEKFRDAAATQTDLFTGMLKHEKGYAPKTGDWEFFVLNSKATAVTTAHNVQSCINCHAPLRSTDFVSRRYLTAKLADGK